MESRIEIRREKIMTDEEELVTTVSNRLQVEQFMDLKGLHGREDIRCVLVEEKDITPGMGGRIGL